MNATAKRDLEGGEQRVDGGRIEAGHDGVPWGPWLWTLMVLGAIQRLVLANLYGPASYGDTSSYLRLAKALSERFLAGYDATRAPGYPVLLALVDLDTNTVWLVQMGLGWCLSIMLYGLAYWLTRKRAVGFAAGLSYNLMPGPFLFEFNLLTETFAAFLLIAAILGVILVWRTAATPWLHVSAMAAGLVATAAALTRSLFFALPLWLALFVWVGLTGERDRRIQGLIAYLLPSLLLLGGWLGWVHQSYGMLSPTTIGGYHLVNHTGEFFEYLPEEEAIIRDVYLKYRRLQIEERGTQINAIWDAVPELTSETGLNFFDLSRRLTRLSVGLILEHPLLYLLNVLEGWVWFWKAPVYWRPEVAHSGILGIMRVWTVLGRALELLFNGLFLLLSLALILSRDFRRRLQPGPIIWAAGGFIWLASWIQALVEHGDNPRFLLPMQGLVALLVIWAAWQWWTSRRSQGGSL